MFSFENVLHYSLIHLLVRFASIASPFVCVRVCASCGARLIRTCVRICGSLTGTGECISNVAMRAKTRRCNGRQRRRLNSAKNAKRLKFVSTENTESKKKRVFRLPERAQNGECDKSKMFLITQRIRNDRNILIEWEKHYVILILILCDTHHSSTIKNHSLTSAAGHSVREH